MQFYQFICELYLTNTNYDSCQPLNVLSIIYLALPKS